MAFSGIRFILTCSHFLLLCIAVEPQTSEYFMSDTNAQFENLPIVHWIMEGNQLIIEKPYNDDNSQLLIICYEGEPQRVVSLFKDAYFYVNITSQEYVLFLGDNVSHVTRQYTHYLNNGSNILLRNVKKVSVQPFKQSCLGVVTEIQQYSIELRVLVVSMVRLAWLVIGLALFFCANRISHTRFMSYCFGTSFGVLGLFFIVILLFSRATRKRHRAFIVLFGGLILLGLAMYYVWQNFWEIMMTYQGMVVMYISLVGFVSLTYCIHKGPELDPITYSLLKYIIKSLGLFMISVSCWYNYTSGFCIILFIFTSSNIKSVKKGWLRLFPSKIMPLTEIQYIEQGRIETCKALAELQKYLNSPNFTPFLSLKLFESRTLKRLEPFALHGLHITNDEQFKHDISSEQYPLAADVDGDSDDA